MLLSPSSLYFLSSVGHKRLQFTVNTVGIQPCSTFWKISFLKASEKLNNNQIPPKFHFSPPCIFFSYQIPFYVSVYPVNYRGSTGFGQDSILSLIGQIGSQDVKDVQVLPDRVRRHCVEPQAGDLTGVSLHRGPFSLRCRQTSPWTPNAWL